jgi:hypothetical protein
MHHFLPLDTYCDSKSCAGAALLILALAVGCQSVETSVDPMQWSEPTRIEMDEASTGPADVAVDETPTLRARASLRATCAPHER